jgi:RimJ/RimL family protein N-acetyltransferase
MLQTERLLLRPWRKSDLAPFAALNADSQVAATLGSVLTAEASDELAQRLQAAIERNGWGYWALEFRSSGEFAGFTGLAEFLSADEEGVMASAEPRVEIGWRLARHFWGQGLVTEAARAALQFGFETLALPEIIAITAAINHRSMAVMTRLGMQRDHRADFLHRRLPAGDPLRPHVYYRLGVARWRTLSA